MSLSNKTKPLLTLAIIMTLTILPSITLNGFADTTKNDFVTVTDKNISNNPTIAKILENIEKSKKEFSDSQQKTEQEKLVDEQRLIAKNILEQELTQMFKDNEEYTPLSAFKKFLNKVPDDDTKTVFQGLFDYHQDKVNAARDAMHKVLQNGGSLQEARNAYHEAAAIPRIEMIQLVKELNIDVGFSDPDIQSHFDINGKLPRYDDEQESVLSFVDLTSSATNVNSSANSTNQQLPNSNNTTQTVESHSESNNETVSNNVIDQLLEEIRQLKNKIKELENNNVQNIVLTSDKSPLSRSYFAEWLISSSQGLTSVPNQSHSMPYNVLNKPDSYDYRDSFFSLGNQGNVVVKFSQPVNGELTVYEADVWGKATFETALVEVSSDGKNWYPLDSAKYKYKHVSSIHEFTYPLSNIGCIEYVRVTDTSIDTEDGFDVDAIGATQLCNIPQ